MREDFKGMQGGESGLQRTVAARVRRCLDLRMETQKSLADRIGKAPSTLSRYLNGTLALYAEVLKDLAEALGTNVSYLVGEEASPYAEADMDTLIARSSLKRRLLDDGVSSDTETLCRHFESVRTRELRLRDLQRATGLNYAVLRSWYLTWLEGGEEELRLRRSHARRGKHTK